jgi:hypothetical protein
MTALTIWHWTFAAVAMYLAAEITRHVLELHAQGFLKLVPNIAMVGACAAVAYAAQGTVVALLTALCVGLGLVTVAHGKRTMRRSADRLEAANKYFKSEN